MGFTQMHTFSEVVLDVVFCADHFPAVEVFVSVHSECI